eukprot:TRINITY_DN9210_c0_g1_i1.p1 TRINITY_DN9210_c0_g1~~TRINITY_DN9210_c0_g1_i1.p1  ORF type:complete len:339 (-),score=34.04 TRINITY_DN9210_c0_g1_i1:37-1053(-)
MSHPLLLATWFVLFTGHPVHSVTSVRPRVVNRLPHNSECFTQGLVFRGEAMLESCGRYGRSCLREVKLPTWETQRQVDNAADLFAEGIALLPDDRIIQLTWKAGKAFEYDAITFQLRRTFEYSGEGWGLCYQQSSGLLAMSDGSSSITFRNSETFEVVRRISVTLHGNPVRKLNELECVGKHVYANIWYSNTVVRIDGDTGSVDCSIDATELTDQAGGGDVLNGIAYKVDNGNFVLTGKLWPAAFEADLGSCGGQSGDTTTSSSKPTAVYTSTTHSETAKIFEQATTTHAEPTTTLATPQTPSRDFANATSSTDRYVSAAGCPLSSAIWLTLVVLVSD